jgi:hypothetical protein
LCFITSNSWLDVGYGKDLQEFLLKYCHVKAIYDNEAKRSFEHADVNTIIALFGPPQISKGGNDWPALKEMMRFVMFKRPFEESVNTKNLLTIEKADSIHKTESYRVYPVKQEMLLEEGWEQPEDEEEVSEPSSRVDKVLSAIVGTKAPSPGKTMKQPASLLKEKFSTGKYEGNKWGGKYLRAPDVFIKIVNENAQKLKFLHELARYDYGIKTGKVKFFYLNKEKIDTFGIEPQYIMPMVTSSRSIQGIEIEEPEKVFYCHDSEKNLKGTGALKYIKWGEKNGMNEGPSVESNRPYWYSINGEFIDFLLLRFWDKRFFTPIAKRKMLSADNFFYGKFYENTDIGKAQLNTTFFFLQIELLGRTNQGEGVLNTYGPDFKWIKLVDNKLFPEKFSNIFRNLCRRDVKDIFIECGFNQTRPIREQKPNPLPDRKALDDIVFDILGLTEDERNEVYWAVCELVKNRLEKARSV